MRVVGIPQMMHVSNEERRHFYRIQNINSTYFLPVWGSQTMFCSSLDVNGQSSCQKELCMAPPPTSNPTPRRGTSEGLGRICLTFLTRRVHVNSKLKGERKCLFCSQSPVQHFIFQKCARARACARIDIASGFQSTCPLNGPFFVFVSLY